MVVDAQTSSLHHQKLIPLTSDERAENRSFSSPGQVTHCIAPKSSESDHNNYYHPYSIHTFNEKGGIDNYTFSFAHDIYKSPFNFLVVVISRPIIKVQIEQCNNQSISCILKSTYKGIVIIWTLDAEYLNIWMLYY